MVGKVPSSTSISPSSQVKRFRQSNNNHIHHDNVSNQMQYNLRSYDSSSSITNNASFNARSSHAKSTSSSSSSSDLWSNIKYCYHQFISNSAIYHDIIYPINKLANSITNTTCNHSIATSSPSSLIGYVIMSLFSNLIMVGMLLSSFLTLSSLDNIDIDHYHDHHDHHHDQLN